MERAYNKRAKRPAKNWNERQRSMSPAADRERAIFNYFKKKFPGLIVTQSFLRLEVLLGAQSVLDFQVANNQGSATVTERRLAVNDAFVADKLSLMLYKLDTATPGKNGDNALLTYPNPITFPTAGEAAALQNLYNGYLSMRIDSTVYVDSLDIQRFYRVGVAQKGVDLGGGTGISPDIYTADSYPSVDYPFEKLSPTITLSGSQKNEIKAVLPESVNMAAPAGEANYAVLLMRGLLISDGAKFNTKD